MDVMAYFLQALKQRVAADDGFAAQLPEELQAEISAETPAEGS